MITDSFDHGSMGMDIPARLTDVEITILAFLQTHTYLADPVIDIVLLQEGCLEKGLGAAEFCQGFLGLLARRLVEPQGELRYALSSAGRSRLKSVSTLAVEARGI